MTLAGRLQSLAAQCHGELELEKALESSQPSAPHSPSAAAASCQVTLGVDDRDTGAGAELLLWNSEKAGAP